MFPIFKLKISPSDDATIADFSWFFATFATSPSVFKLQGTVEGVILNRFGRPIDQFFQDVGAHLEGEDQGGQTNVIQMFDQPAQLANMAGS